MFNIALVKHIYQLSYHPIAFPQVLIMSPPMAEEAVYWKTLGDIIHTDCDENDTSWSSAQRSIYQSRSKYVLNIG